MSLPQHPVLIDSHCHLNYLYDPEARLAEARAAGVTGFLCIGVDRAGADDVLGLAQRHPDVWASVGVHPDAAATQPDVEWLAPRTHEARVVAVGETGLDFFRLDAADRASREAQKRAFDRQLEIAREAQLPAVVHTRAAEAETRCLLEAHAGVVGVLHCFTESWDLARIALDLGWFVSISGIVTFRNADNVRDVARRVPSDRLLIETDAPWLAPVPHRGVENHPALLRHTLDHLAALRGVDPEELAARTACNFHALFSRAAP